MVGPDLIAAFNGGYSRDYTRGNDHALRPVVGVDAPRADKRFVRDSGSMNEYRADGLALVGATGNGEDEDVPSVRPGVLGALIGNRDNV